MSTIGQQARTGTGTAAAARPYRKGALLAAWLSSTDHKVIGHLYLITSFGFFLAAGLMAMIMRAQVLEPVMAGYPGHSSPTTRVGLARGACRTAVHLWWTHDCYGSRGRLANRAAVVAVAHDQDVWCITITDSSPRFYDVYSNNIL